MHCYVYLPNTLRQNYASCVKALQLKECCKSQVAVNFISHCHAIRFFNKTYMQISFLLKMVQLFHLVSTYGLKCGVLFTAKFVYMIS